MSTPIASYRAPCGNLSVVRYWGGREHGVSVAIVVEDKDAYVSFSLSKQEVVELCADIIKSMNELKDHGSFQPYAEREKP